MTSAFTLRPSYHFLQVTGKSPTAVLAAVRSKVQHGEFQAARWIPPSKFDMSDASVPLLMKEAKRYQTIVEDKGSYSKDWKFVAFQHVVTLDSVGKTFLSTDGGRLGFSSVLPLLEDSSASILATVRQARPTTDVIHRLLQECEGVSSVRFAVQESSKDGNPLEGHEIRHVVGAKSSQEARARVGDILGLILDAGGGRFLSLNTRTGGTTVIGKELSPTGREEGLALCKRVLHVPEWIPVEQE